MAGKKIVVIGAGFTGLVVAIKLAKSGFDVEVFESLEKPGGLAIGFKHNKWQWPLEKHYHHLFTSDKAIIQLAKEVSHPIRFYRPKTSIFSKGRIQQIDSPMSLLRFSQLTFIDKLRTGVVMAILKINPFWKDLEKITVEKFVITTMGIVPWTVLWKPLLYKKFGDYAKIIPASWFWARVKKRSASLGYPVGGFDALSKKVFDHAKSHNVQFHFNTQVIKVLKKSNKFEITTLINGKKSKYNSDLVVCTLPTPLLVKIVPQLPKKYITKVSGLIGIGATNLVLELKKKFLEDGTYWLNMNELEIPFLGVVEQTNFISPRRYGGSRIVYIGNYMNANNDLFSLDARTTLDIYFPYLKQINKSFKKSDIKNAWIFKAPFAQPIIYKNYSKKIPPFATPVKGLYLANMQQVYPWDRGTNYAVSLGNKISKLLITKYGIQK